MGHMTRSPVTTARLSSPPAAPKARHRPLRAALGRGAHRLRDNRVVPVPFAFAGLCGALVLCGSSAVAAPGPEPTRSPGTEAHIIIYAVNTDGPYYRAVLSGAIGDYGPAVAVYPDGQVDPGHSHELQLELTQGSFRLDIAQMERDFLAHVVVPQPQFPTTCSDYINFTVTVPIVAGSGTGLYRGVRGGFNLTATADETQARPCVPPLHEGWEVIAIVGSGTVVV
jgi:hypothetical protein